MVWRVRHIFNGGACAMLLFALNAVAEPPVLSQLSPAHPLGLLHPVVSVDNRLSGKSLIAELRKGGYVLYMRHAETGRVTEQCGISNLTSAGEDEAKQIGAAIGALNIPVSEVFSSPACRAVDTARLLDLGMVKMTDDLAAISANPTFDLALARQQRLVTQPTKATNIFLVSHMHGGQAINEALQLAIAEIIVFRPASSSAPAPVARILAKDWGKLLAIDKN